MKKLFNKLSLVPRRYMVLAGALLAAIIIPAAINAWGPDRQPFTWNNPATYVTFNSMTDNAKVGDERNFVRIREAGVGDYADEAKLVPGKEYQVMVFYHNNAASNLNESGKGIAQNATARVEMAGRVQAGETTTITGFVSADNAQPQTVWDEAKATTQSDVALRYVQGSAKIASSNGAVNGAALSNDLFAGGVSLGYDSLNGKLPGCNEYSGYITYQFTVDKPDFTITKEVSVDGGKTWHENAKTTPGSTIQYRLVYTNTGTVQQDDVVLKDVLPTGVSYVAGSSKIANSKTGGDYAKTADGVVSEGGFNIGSYAPKGNAYFTFSAKVAENDKLADCGDNSLTNKVSAFTENGNKSDTATVTVPKECEPEEPTASYSCDQLAVQKINRTTFKFDIGYSAENAKYDSVEYVVRNSDGDEVYRGSNAQYSQTTPGEYSVQAYVTFTVNGEKKTVTADACKKNFTVKAPENTPGVAIEKLVDGKDHKEVAVGETFTYQLKVTNTGDTTLKDVRVSDNMPENVMFIRADAGEISTGKWTHTIPELKKGETVTFAITAKVTKEVEGTINNVACVDAPEMPGTPDDCDNATVEVPPTTPTTPEVPETPETPETPSTPETPTTPSELPQTGTGETLLSILGISALALSATYYVISRRSLGSM